MNHPGLTVHAMYTMGGERTNGVFFDNVDVPDEYRVGELNKGFQYIAEALDVERFTLFTFSPMASRCHSSRLRMPAQRTRAIRTS